MLYQNESTMRVWPVIRRAVLFVMLAAVLLVFGGARSVRAVDFGRSGSVKVGTPVLSKVENTSAGIKFTWKKASRAKGYQIYRKTGDGAWTKIATVKGASKTSYTDKKAADGSLYTYTVRGYNGKSLSAMYKTGKKVIRIVAPKLESVTSQNSGNATVRWSGKSMIDKVQIQFARKSSFAKATTYTLNMGVYGSLNFTTFLTPGASYWFKVRTSYESGSVRSYSAWSNVKKVKIKK